MAVPTRIRLAALLATSVVVLAACGADADPQASDPNGRPSHSGKPSRTPHQTDSSTPSQSASGADTVAVPLYFVGDTPQGPRLFREFQQVATDNPVDEALAILAAGAAHDPDYGSLLPEGTPTVVQGDNSQAIGVNVPVEWADRPGDMSAKEAALAVQQIVFTVQGALQSRAPVEFYSDGLTPVFGIDKSSFQADQDALAFVNVTEPEEGSIVGDTFTASGVANSFEATVPWEIRDQGGTKVLDGFSTAEGWMDKLYPWQTQVDVSSLAPGTYSFVAMTDDPSDGEGPGPTEDSKTIIIQ
ncbi:MAG TPA: Gmad2 immunoglobulin-like domain-containing protein [Nocardioides sp.]|nr:Gmad2 immunoglobulin-like domain-containing protein [Nocardioides sp.]